MQCKITKKIYLKIKLISSSKHKIGLKLLKAMNENFVMVKRIENEQNIKISNSNKNHSNYY